ncbi:pyruvate formate-lyase activating enzyme [Lachnospiraceae bacterium KM106-2]|nr:pyruvate formate-lyase activating enzyme [Lachnospiraceae bacterium KM106-2]
MDQINYSLEGLVFDIQRFSIHDGPGVRTIVFLKGCPLSCKWCSNPESQSIKPVVMFNPSECIHCGTCMKVCRQGAIDPSNKGLIDRDRCIGCGECANACPTGALVLKGKRMSVEQVIMELKKDATNYRRSGGGITISGGEPLVQHEFCKEILKAANAQGWHTAIETTACASKEVLEDVIPHVDLALMDIKQMDPDVHKKYTGITNDLILSGTKIVSHLTKTIVRVPVIPGFNNRKEDILSIASYAKELSGVDTLHLLPYHSYGENKYGLLGRDYFMKDTKTLSETEIEGLKEIVESQGLKCIIGG